MRISVFFALCVTVWSQNAAKSIAPSVAEAIQSISEDRVAATIRKLEGFRTRDTNGLVEAPDRGIAAARQWIFDEMKSYSPNLEVRLDPHPVKKGGRVVRDTEAVNVIAVLPGTREPAVQIVIGAHYDSMAMIFKPPTTPGGQRTFDADATAAVELAPGAADNASGVACVMELARVLSKQRLPKSIVFIAFAGEEQGLIGANGYAKRAKEKGESIEAVLNVDTIGTDVTGNGIRAGNRVNLYSGDPMDSGSRALARYVREVDGRYLPELTVNLVFREDRFGRGGDHSPFHREGFPAVRFTTPTEQLENQHNDKDTADRVSMPYTALVTRGVVAPAANLALAPAPPRLRPISRGSGMYDAVLRWQPQGPEDAIAGYSVMVRSTLAPDWEREISVGKVNEYVLKNNPVDELVFGVRAIGTNGAESLVAAWVLRPSAFTAPASTSTVQSPAR